jgi:hypothetical protein
MPATGQTRPLINADAVPELAVHSAQLTTAMIW